MKENGIRGGIRVGKCNREVTVAAVASAMAIIRGGALRHPHLQRASGLQVITMCPTSALDQTR